MKETGRWASSLYMGGGTSTILSTSEIFALLNLFVEVGRPDTLSKEKLQALREQEVNRLSINPQALHNRTLKRIGRAHTVEDILRIYEFTREIPGWAFYMDLILELHGETVADVRESLKKIGEFKPDNLAVNALAIKRLAQNLRIKVEMMQKKGMSSTRALGMRLY